MDLVWHNIKMSSSNTPSPFMVTTSSNYASSFAGWMAFDGVNNNTNACWSANANRGWITFDFGMENKQKVACVEISARVTTANGAPKDFTIEISNDNLNWTTVKTIVNETGWTSAQSRQYMLTSNYLARYIRINITANNGRERLDIGEIRFAYIPPINKTLILSNDEYKKYNYKTDEILTYEKIVMNLTSNSSNGYEVSGTTALTSAPLFHVFDGNNGTHFRSNSGTTADIILKLPTKKRIGKFILTPYASSYPVKYGLYASNDGVIWTTLKEGNFNSTGTYEREQILDNKNEYIYYKFSALSNSGGSYVYIYEIEYFKTIVEENAIPAHWSTVSTALPTSTQFLEQGMDNLSPLLDRKVTTFEPMPMINKSEILGVGEIGKVFSKTIDLKKYFDIRSMKVEVK